MGDPRNAETPPLAEVSELRKRYGAVTALRGVSLTVRGGEVLGLCGHNGAGKSTLVKMLVGLDRPDSGTIRVAGQDVVLNGVQAAQRHGIAMLDQELSLVPELTVAENVFLGNVDERRWINRAERDGRTRALLDTVGLQHIAPTRLVEQLSLGERQLIEIARLLGRNAKVLILDEPTATLTDAEITNVFAAVRAVVADGAGVVFVSHRLDEVLDICDRVVVMRDGNGVADQPVSTLTKPDLVTLMLGEQAQASTTGPDPAATRSSGGTGLSVRGLTVGHRVHDVDLDVPAGTIVGLAGQLGAGAGEILASLAGLEADVSGEIFLDGRAVRLADTKASAAAGVQYVSSDRKAGGLFITRSIESNLIVTRLGAYSSGGVLQRGRLRTAARKLAQRVGVDARLLPLPVGTLSGGNQQKIFVGRCLDRSDLRVLLLDEPTRGVDVGGRAEIHNLIRQAAAQGAAVLFASSELDEVLDLSDVVISLYAGRVVSTRPRAETDTAEVFRDMTHRRGEELVS